MKNQNHDELLRWLASGERGESSNAMVQHIAGIYTGRSSHPLDPADLRRCFLLCDAVPEIADKYLDMVTCSRYWAALIPHWHELRDILDDEVPGWESGATGSSRRCYARMRELLVKAEVPT